MKNKTAAVVAALTEPQVGDWIRFRSRPDWDGGRITSVRRVGDGRFDLQIADGLYPDPGQWWCHIEDIIYLEPEEH